MKRTVKYLLPGALALAFVVAPAVTTPTVFAQDAAAAPAVNQDEMAALDKKFRDNFKTNPAVAYEAAKEYLQKFSAVPENAEFVKYLQNWIGKYEKLQSEQGRVKKFTDAVTAKNNEQVFTASREWMSAEANNPYPLFVTVDYGFNLATAATPVNTYNAQTIELAKQAISKIESGQLDQTKWADYKFKDKNDALAWMNYMVGYILFANEKGREAESVPYFYKAMQYDSTIKNSKPLAYYALGFNYLDQYNKGVKEFQDKSAGKTELDQELKDLAGKNKAIADRAIDAFARAVKIAEQTKNANKDAWMNDLTKIYKVRFNNQTTGMSELVAGVLSKPLPDPASPVTPVMEEPTTTTTGSTTGTTNSATPTATASGNGTATTTNSSTTNRPRTTTTNSNTTTAKPASTTNNSNTATPKPAPKKPTQ
jgi:hypothetical protein